MCACGCVRVRMNACACVRAHVSTFMSVHTSACSSSHNRRTGSVNTTRRAPLSAIAAAGTKVLIAGSPAGHTPLVDIYDVNTNAWTVGTLRSGRSQLAGAGTGNKVCVCVCVCSSCLSCAVFACGGANHLVYASWSLVTSLLGVVWSQAQLSVARFLLAAGAVGNKVVFAGGTHMRVWVGVVLDL